MSSLEIQLFYIEDEQRSIERVLSDFKENRHVDMTAMLLSCVTSIKKHNPFAEVTLVTNPQTKFHQGIEGITVIETSAIKPETLVYDLNVFRRNYVEKNKHINKRIFFTDIDVLINCDLNSVFEENFDIKTAIWSSSPYKMTDKGLPDHSLMFRFTGGGFFVTCNDRSLSFFDDYVSLWKKLYNNDDFANYGILGPSVKENFLNWWGEIHTFCVMVGPEVLSGKTKEKTISSCRFQFLNEDDFNFAPDFSSLNLQDPILRNLQLGELLKNLKSKKIIHFRGTRKKHMNLFASKLGA